MVNTARQTSRVTLATGSSAVADSSTRSDEVPTSASRAVTVQTSPARTGPDQTQSLTALKNTVCSGTTARAATTQAAMSIQLIMWPPCITPRVFDWAGITRIERT